MLGSFDTGAQSKHQTLVGCSRKKIANWLQVNSDELTLLGKAILIVDNNIKQNISNVKTEEKVTFR